MAVPTKMSDLSVVAGDNSPVGSESPISTDDFHRSIQAILRTTNAKGSDIASATTTDIGAATAEFVDVTGTTTITGLGTIGAGIVRTVRFTGALTLTHNATSLILPTGRNILTAAGDIAQFRSLGSGNWVCVGYTRASGKPVISNLELLATYTASASATIDITQGFDGSYSHLEYVFERILPATNAVDFYVRVSNDGGATYLTTNTYSSTSLSSSGTTAVSGSADNLAQWALNASTLLSNVGGESLNGKMQLFSPGPGVAGERPYSTSVVAYRTSAGNNSVAIRGQFSTNTGINAIRFFMSSGNIASGKIYVYGVRK